MMAGTLVLAACGGSDDSASRSSDGTEVPAPPDDVALDPAETQYGKALQTHFEFEIALPAARPAGYGGRVYVRFEHGSESIASQVWRGLRQLFLQRLTI